jgi:hypothetical protein
MPNKLVLKPRDSWLFVFFVNSFTVISDFTYFLNTYRNDVLPMRKDIDSFVGNGNFETKDDVMDAYRLLRNFSFLCILVSFLQMCLTFAISGIQSLHVMEESGPQRQGTKLMLRMTFLDGILIESLMLYLTIRMDNLLEVQLTKNTD